MTTLDLSPSISLTPMRNNRRKRPSFSPIKYAQPSPPPRAKSAEPTSEPHPELGAVSDQSMATAALTFSEFDYWDNDRKCFVQLTAKHQRALLEYLQAQYDVVDMETYGAYLILRCSPVAPKPDSRPFTIASRVGVWLDEDEDAPVDMLPGRFGSHFPVEVEAEIAQDLRQYQIPQPRTLLAFGQKYFPEASHITYMNADIIVELPECDEDDFDVKLSWLPDGISNAGVELRFHNGPLTQTEMKRLKKPEPAKLTGVCDDVDYVRVSQCFYPGTLLTSDADQQVSAGIQIQKGQEVRLTVAYHCWNQENAANLGLPGHFKVTQGLRGSGTEVGNVVARVGTTDIGLAQLRPHIAFSNRFLGIEAVPKTLIRSEQVMYGDTFMIDSFVTGIQTLKSVGSRMRTGGRERDFRLPPGTQAGAANLPPPGSYIGLIQGVHATSKPEFRSQPQIREGMCGSALVRSTVKGEGGLGNLSVLGRGEIAGFMHFSDLNPKTVVSAELHCYCDSVDGLIDDGWSVVQPGPKRKFGEWLG